ncbi:bssS family protein [Kluyvera cryocrescens]|uniref:bssS family protein n=1 Tax=Kluyvera cryocrescens TaxID=580 RepID=UPI002DB7DB7F|nr:bssS family protein [Kluyvera cryocrescens]MEB7559147.1 bssS family protein [Kluyvera cryocrescens]
MSKTDDIPVFPVTGWQAKPLPGYDALAMKFEFIPSLLQPIESPRETQFFALTPEMAESLISELQTHIESLRKPDVGSPFKSRH